MDARYEMMYFMDACYDVAYLWFFVEYFVLK